MDIAELLKNEQGKNFWCDVAVIVKKPKRPNKETQTQDCVLSDDSGDVEATLDISSMSVVESKNLIRIIRAEVQHGANAAGTKLYVHAFIQEKATEPEPYAPPVHYSPAEIEQNGKSDWDKIAKGKTRCNIVCAMITNGQIDVKNPAGIDADLGYDARKNIDKLVEYIFTGK